jgi:hypothetical protein
MVHLLPPQLFFCQMIIFRLTKFRPRYRLQNNITPLPGTARPTTAAPTPGKADADGNG